MVSYFDVINEVVKLVIKKQMVDWQTYLLNSDILCTLVKTFVIAYNDKNKLGKKAIHFYTQNTVMDELVSDTRCLVLSMVYELVREVLTKTNAGPLGYHKTAFKDTVGDLAVVICESLIDTANQQGTIYQLIELGDFISKSILLQIKFVGGICTKNNLFFTTFQNYGELMFKMIVIPLTKISPTESEKLEDDPQEFVNYAMDLVGFHRSETPKSEAINMFEFLVENVDGFLTKCFHLLFGMLTETVSQVEGEVSRNLASVDKLKLLTPVDRIDIALLLLTAVSYVVCSRDDLLAMIKGFVLGHMDKLLSLDSVLLQTRLMLFFTNYSEYLFEVEADAKYMQLMMKHISACLLHVDTQPVVVYCY